MSIKMLEFEIKINEKPMHKSVVLDVEYKGLNQGIMILEKSALHNLKPHTIQIICKK